MALKFLEAYQKNDADIFFGREKESSLLYEKVRKSRLTLLYGLSGTGKTSLVRCGLANKFHETDWYELYIRRGQHILRSMRTMIDDHADTFIRKSTSDIEALNILYLDYFRPIYLIFDQFEELFISGTPTEIQEFFDFLAELLDNENLNFRVLLILREEYFTNLDAFEIQIPIIFDNRMRLELMSQQRLEDVLAGIAKSEKLTFSPTSITDQLLNFVRDEQEQVQLPYLQVYLDRLLSHPQLVQQSGNKIIDTDLLNEIGTLEDILGTFLEEQLEVVAKEMSKSRWGLSAASAKKLAWQIMKSMITMDGTKQSSSMDDLLNTLERDLMNELES